MKKNLGKLSLLFMVLFVTVGFMSCDLNSSDSLAIIGEWDTSYDWDGATTEAKIVFTETSYESYTSGTLNYSAKIVSYDNDKWNSGETGEGSHGHMVIQFDVAPSYAPERVDKFMVLRWENFIDGTSMEYSEGSDFPTNTYYDTADDALEGATGAAGFFSYFTSVPKL